MFTFFEDFTAIFKLVNYITRHTRFRNDIKKSVQTDRIHRSHDSGGELKQKKIKSRNEIQFKFIGYDFCVFFLPPLNLLSYSFQLLSFYYFFLLFF